MDELDEGNNQQPVSAAELGREDEANTTPPRMPEQPNGVVEEEEEEAPTAPQTTLGRKLNSGGKTARELVVLPFLNQLNRHLFPTDDKQGQQDEQETHRDMRELLETHCHNPDTHPVDERDQIKILDWFSKRLHDHAKEAHDALDAALPLLTKTRDSDGRSKFSKRHLSNAVEHLQKSKSADVREFLESSSADDRRKILIRLFDRPGLQHILRNHVGAVADELDMSADSKEAQQWSCHHVVVAYRWKELLEYASLCGKLDEMSKAKLKAEHSGGANGSLKGTPGAGSESKEDGSTTAEEAGNSQANDSDARATARKQFESAYQKIWNENMERMKRTLEDFEGYQEDVGEKSVDECEKELKALIEGMKELVNDPQADALDWKMTEIFRRAKPTLKRFTGNSNDDDSELLEKLREFMKDMGEIALTALTDPKSSNLNREQAKKFLNLALELHAPDSEDTSSQEYKKKLQKFMDDMEKLAQESPERKARKMVNLCRRLGYVTASKKCHSLRKAIQAGRKERYKDALRDAKENVVEKEEKDRAEAEHKKWMLFSRIQNPDQSLFLSLSGQDLVDLHDHIESGNHGHLHQLWKEFLNLLESYRHQWFDCRVERLLSDDDVRKLAKRFNGMVQGWRYVSLYTSVRPQRFHSISFHLLTS